MPVFDSMNVFAGHALHSAVYGCAQYPNLQHAPAPSVLFAPPGSRPIPVDASTQDTQAGLVALGVYVPLAHLVRAVAPQGHA